MQATIYSLLGILWWNLIGQYMYYVYARLSLSEFWIKRLLPRFDPGPPQWWLDSWPVSYWWNNNLDDRVPNTAFVLFYRSAARDRFEDWIENAADSIARPLVNAVSNLLGSLLHGYTTFSIWIDAIRGRVGSWVPWWTNTLASGVDFLRYLFPSAIRNALTTWDDIWESIKIAAAIAADVLYSAARDWVANTAPWLLSSFTTVAAWYTLVHTWVTNFRNDPYGTVAGWLGSAWSTWTGIYGSILDFYNNVWVPFGVTLHDFLDDPLMWMYDRVEDELIRRW